MGLSDKIMDKELLIKVLKSDLPTEEKADVIVRLSPRRQTINPENYRDLMKMANENKYTLQQLGDVFGITRERVRQIYKKLTGKSYGVERRKKILSLSDIAAQQNLKRLEEPKICPACKKEYFPRTLHQKMCLDCRLLIKGNRDPYTWCKCLYCGKDFHPIRTWRFVPALKNKYCSQEHYMLSDQYQENISKRKVKA